MIIGAAETLANDLGVLSLVKESGLFYFAKQTPEPAKAALKPPALALGMTSGKPAPAVGPLAAQSPAPPYQHRPPALSTDDALRLTLEKQYDEALAILALLLKQQPDTSAALLLKAHIQLHRKDYAAAEENAQLALTIEPWSTDAFVLLGLAAKWRNQSDAALKWFKQAVYARNECWPAHYYLGELYRSDNKMDNARRAYRVVLQLLSAQQAPTDGLSIIPLGLPVSEVRFLCLHQLAKLGDNPSMVSN